MLRVNELQTNWTVWKIRIQNLQKGNKKHQNMVFFDRTALIRQGSGPNIQRDRLLRKGLLPIYFLKIANGKKDLVTKKVGYSWIGSSCNFDLHVFGKQLKFSRRTFKNMRRLARRQSCVQRASLEAKLFQRKMYSLSPPPLSSPLFLLPTIPHR